MSNRVKLNDGDRRWNRSGKNRCWERSVDVRAERQRILIVCEGEKTEPNYFEAFKRKLRPQVATIKIHGKGANTLSLVNKAKEIRDLRAPGDFPFDQVWVVFDRDSFKPYNFDNAIAKAKANNMQCAWSNEAFELWYILHFAYLSAGIRRSAYQQLLNTYLKEPYKKNSLDMYEKLARLGNQKQAIAWAKKLVKNAKSHGLPASRSNPCTTVYLLVEELNKFIS